MRVCVDRFSNLNLNLEVAKGRHKKYKYELYLYYHVMFNSRNMVLCKLKTERVGRSGDKHVCISYHISFLGHCTIGSYCDYYKCFMSLICSFIKQVPLLCFMETSKLVLLDLPTICFKRIHVATDC